MTEGSAWLERDLGELAVLDPENLREDTDHSFSFYYIDIGSVSEGKISLPSHKIPFRESPSRARKVVHRGDVLMSTVRPNLKAFAYFDHVDDDCVASTGFAVLRARPEADPRFILYAILSAPVTAQIESHVVGSNYPAITSSAVNRLRVLSPPLREQTKIAEILSTVDRAIEQTEVLIAKQQRIKTGLMQDLLTRGIDEHGDLRSEQTHQFKDSPLGWIPEEWEVATVLSVLSGAPKNGYSPVESDQWNGVYMLGLGCLTPDGFEPTQLKYAPPRSPASEVAELSPGDFLISRSNTRSLVGLVGIFRDVGVPCIYPDLMIRLSFKSAVSVQFMEIVFSSSAMRRQIEAEATGTSGSMVKINSSVIKRCVFPRPSLEEQGRVVARLETQRRHIQEIKVAREKLASLKTALMQDLLTGKRRVTDLLEQAGAVTA